MAGLKNMRSPSVEIVGLDPEVRELFCSTEGARARLKAARRILHGVVVDGKSRDDTGVVGGLQGALEPALQQKGDFGFDVEQCVRLEGYEVRAMQQAWGLFNPTRDVGLTRWAYEQLDAPIEDPSDSRAPKGSLAAVVEEAVERVATVAVLPERIVVGVIPADPANYNLMVHCGGLSCSGQVEGYALVEIWPSAGNLRRLASVVARSLLMARRWSQRPLATLADYLEAEGSVAKTLVELELVPKDWLRTPWGLAVLSPLDHAEALNFVAGRYGLKHYSEMKTNIYGQLLESEDFGMKRKAGARSETSSFGSKLPDLDLPVAEVLSPEDLAYSEEVLADEGLLDSTAPHTIAAGLFGDSAVCRYGHRALGLSSWAGLQIAFVRNGGELAELSRSRRPLRGDLLK